MVCRLPGVGRAEVFGSAFGRALLVLGFVAALAIPLTAALTEVVREARVRGAVEEAVDMLQLDGVTSVVWRQVELGADSSTARIRVATTTGVSAAAREAFESRASHVAGEPVHLRLEQLPVAAGDASALQALLRAGGRPRENDNPEWPVTVARAREALERAAWSLPFPQGAEAIGVTLRVEGGDAAIAADSVEVAYLAPWSLQPQAAEVLGGALRRAVGHPALRTSFYRAGPAVLELEPPDTASVLALIAVVRRYPGLRVSIISAAADSVMSAAVLETLRAAGVDSVDIRQRLEPGPLDLRMAGRIAPAGG
jgi:hypothetical protein